MISRYELWFFEPAERKLMKCRYTCSGCFSNMAGSLTIIAIALAIQEMVANWTSMMVSHRSIKARTVDL